MDSLSSAYMVQAIKMAQELGLFEPTTYIMNKKLRNSYDLTAWSLFHWQCTLSYQLMTVPVLQTPPRNKLPDPKRDPDWFGEIWLKYPSSSVLIPIQVGLTFQTKMNFAVVLNEAMLDYHRDSNDDDLAQNGAVRIMAVVQRLESWYQSLPEPLSPSNIVFPSHLKIHLHYCYVLVQLYEILAPEGKTKSSLVQFDEEELFQSLSKYRAHFETILRIHYLRHSFGYGNMMLTRFLAMLAFLTLNKLDYLVTEPREALKSSALDIGDTDPKEVRATLLIAQKGLSDQGRGYYLPNILLQDVLRLSIGQRPLARYFCCILRDMRIAQQKTNSGFDYKTFKPLFDQEDLKEGQIVPPQQRLDTLESFMHLSRLPTLLARIGICSSSETETIPPKRPAQFPSSTWPSGVDITRY
ncbi:hypothetical protein NW766_001964 [Fusarium irregulare]|uniref:Transcription factor domain-containing protein n=1 Tax=Fusarium irregulare TaxID=2494466 RepID=A0A9W8PX29_9HYPO|nr:hypothetical protein NW766_001964 [Fusarium irregulare]